MTPSSMQAGQHIFTASVEETLRKEEHPLENAEMWLSSPIKVRRYVQQEKGIVSLNFKTELHSSSKKLSGQRRWQY